MAQPSPGYFLPDQANASLTIDSDSRSTFEVVIQATSMAFILLSGCIGNILILLAIYVDRTLQTVTNSFVINLAVADLLLSLIGMPFTLISSVTYEWIFGPAWCNINGMANSLFCVASILTLAAVSIDRYIAIIHPLRYTSYMTRKAAGCMIMYIWFHSLSVSLLPVFGWSEYTFLKKESICTVHWQLDISCTIFIFVVCFFLPLAVIMCTYSRILKTAWAQSKRIVPVTGRISLRGKDVTLADSSTNLSRNPSDGSLDSRYQISRETVSTYDRSLGSQSTDEFLSTRTQQYNKSMPLRMLENNYTEEFDEGISKISTLYTNEPYEDLIAMNLDKELSDTELNDGTQKDTGLNNSSTSNMLVNEESTKVLKEKNNEKYKESLLTIENANRNEYHEQSTSFNSKIKDRSVVVNGFIVRNEEEGVPVSSEKISPSLRRQNDDSRHESASVAQEMENDDANGRRCTEDNTNDDGVGICHSMDIKEGQKDTMGSTTGISRGNESEQSSGSSVRGSNTSDDVFFPSNHDDATERNKIHGSDEKYFENNNNSVPPHAAKSRRQTENGRTIHFQTTGRPRISVVVSPETPNDSPQPQPGKRQRRVTLASYPNQLGSSKSNTQTTHDTRRQEEGVVGVKETDVSKSTPCLQNASSQVSLRVEDTANVIKRKLSSWSNPSVSIQALKKKYTNSTAGILKMKQDKKAVRTLLIVVGTFVLCWLPHFIGIFCLITNECTWPDRYFAITTWLAMLNSGCNPVIYGAMSRQFRKRFRQILQCKRGFF